MPDRVQERSPDVQFHMGEGRRCDGQVRLLNCGRRGVGTHIADVQSSQFRSGERS